jgi:SPX domain protein involved in polyphosphate accumulation
MLLRVERKYLVPNDKIDAIRERISSFVSPDLYTRQNGKGISEYTVRSIYFDSKDFSCYAEKHEGLMLRRKFRIRGYNDLVPGSRVVMEIKRKISNRQKKYRSFVMFDDIEKLLHNGDLNRYVIANGNGCPTLTNAAKFMYHVKKKQFIPTCLVSYEREAYFGKMDKGVRITFDKNIRSRLYPTIDSLFDNERMKQLFNRHFILEIKYFTNEMPVWARSLVQEFKLRNDALSKYTIGIDVSRDKVLTIY